MATDVEAAKKARDAARIARSAITSYSDAVLRSGQSSSKALAAMQKRINEERNELKEKGLSIKGSKMLAMSYYDMNKVVTRAAASVFTLNNAFDKVVLSTGRSKDGGVIKHVSLLQAKLATLIPPSDGMVDALQILRPSMFQASNGTEDVGVKMLKVALIAKGLAVAWEVLVGAAQGVRDTFRGLAQGFGFEAIHRQDAIALFTQAKQAQARYNVEMQDTIGTVQTLSSEMIINRTNLAQLGASWAAIIGNSVGEYLALAQATGVSAKEAGVLAKSFIMLGAKAEDLPSTFAELQRQAGKLAIAPSVLVNTLSKLAPVSLFVNEAMAKTYTWVGRLREAWDTSTDSLVAHTRALGTSDLVMTQGIQALTSAASKLSVPELMAFGGGMEPGVNPWQALQAGTKADKSEVLGTYLEKVMQGMSDDNAKFQAAILVNQRFGQDIQASMAAAVMQANINKLEGEGKTVEAQAARETLRANLRNAATMQSMADPANKIMDYLKSLVGMGMQMMEFYRPGTGRALESSMERADYKKFRAGPPMAQGAVSH